MKTLKKLFKPFLCVFVFIGVGVLTLAKKAVLFFKIKPQYTNLVKLENAKAKLYSLVFSPYRICNGIRPVCVQRSAAPLSDLAQCHEIIKQKRQNA